MNTLMRMCVTVATLGILVGIAGAATDADAVKLFRNSEESNAYFKSSYGYAVFPTVGKGGLGIGAAHGSGHVYERGRLIGNVDMNQISVGFQAGGKAFSEIIFFENKKALDQFTAGNFEFSGDVGAIVITASAQASVGTTGENASASTQKKNAETQGGYHNGMAVFTIAKGGLMYNVTVAGQKFSYEAVSGKKVARAN